MQSASGGSDNHDIRLCLDVIPGTRSILRSRCLVHILMSSPRSLGTPRATAMETRPLRSACFVKNPLHSSQRMLVSGVSVVFDVDESTGWIAKQHPYMGLRTLRWLGARHALGRRFAADEEPACEPPATDLGTKVRQLTTDTTTDGVPHFHEGRFLVDPCMQVTLSIDELCGSWADIDKEPAFLSLSGEVALRESSRRPLAAAAGSPAQSPTSAQQRAGKATSQTKPQRRRSHLRRG